MSCLLTIPVINTLKNQLLDYYSRWPILCIIIVVPLSPMISGPRGMRLHGDAGLSLCIVVSDKEFGSVNDFGREMCSFGDLGHLY